MARWRVREFAEPARRNVKKLAEASGLAYGTVYAIWTSQATRVDFTTLDALARVLKVEPGELIGTEEIVEDAEGITIPGLVLAC